MTKHYCCYGAAAEVGCDADCPSRAASPQPQYTEAPAARQWPFAETPGEFANRMTKALREFDGDVLAACRNVLIEHPPTIAVQAPAARDEALYVSRKEHVRILDKLSEAESRYMKAEAALAAAQAPAAQDAREALFNIAPSVGSSTPEPTLRQLIFKYYNQYLGSQKLAASATEHYIDALAARAPQAAAQPKINAVFETVDPRPLGATGTRTARVKRVEQQDDGSFTVVIDHWPKEPKP